VRGDIDATWQSGNMWVDILIHLALSEKKAAGGIGKKARQLEDSSRIGMGELKRNR